MTRRDFLGKASTALAGAAVISPLLRSPSASALVDTRRTDSPAQGAAAGDRTFGPGLDDYIRSAMHDAYLPSLTAAAVNGQTLKWKKGYGWADREAQIQADPNTDYMLASISKTFICAALMQLWEGGSVDLDADVNTYLPFDVRNPKFQNRMITPRMLLTHTSSIRDRYSIWGTIEHPKPTGYVYGDATITLHDILEGYLVPGGAYYNGSQDFYPNAPGQAYRYSNLGADLAAYIVEVVSGELYSDYVINHLLAPLGIVQSGYHLSDISSADIAMPYRCNLATRVFHPYYQYGYPDYPCGCMRTSAHGLSIWLRMWMNQGSFDGTQILEPDTVAEIFRPQIPGTWWQGLIFYYEHRGNRVIVGHNGGDYGVSTSMYFDPKKEVGMVTLTNRYIGGWTAWYRFLDIQNRLFDIA